MRIAKFDRTIGAFIERNPESGYSFRYTSANDAGAHGCIVAGTCNDSPYWHTSLRLLQPVGRPPRRVIVGGAR